MGGTYHAIVIDEGQDFEKAWLESLFYLLVDDKEDVLYVFHDPDQALYREDVVGTLGLPDYYLDWNCRNAGHSPLRRPLRAGAGQRAGAARGGLGGRARAAGRHS